MNSNETPSRDCDPKGDSRMIAVHPTNVIQVLFLVLSGAAGTPFARERSGPGSALRPLE